MEQIKEKKWWFVGAIGLMLVILLTGLLFNFSSVGKNLIEGIGKNAAKSVKLTYDYIGGNKGNNQLKLKKGEVLKLKKGEIGSTSKEKTYLVYINAGQKCTQNPDSCAYCIDITKPLFNTYTNGPTGTSANRDLVALPNSNAWKSLGSNAQNLVTLILLYGYPNKDGKISAEKYIATQVLIWEVQQGYRTDFNSTSSSSPFYKKWVNRSETSPINFPTVKKTYESIIKEASNHSKLPSLSGNVNLKYNASTKKYEAKLTDSSGLLSNGYTVSCSSNITCKIVGNDLIIESDKPVKSDKVTITKKVPKIRKGAVVIGLDKENTQKAIVGVPPVNPVKKDIVIGSSTGGLKIIKTSEDGKVSGIEFKITGPGFSGTKKTNADGVIEISPIAPGKYVIEEVNPGSQYDKPKSVTVTVNDDSIVKEVGFNNVLKSNSSLKILKVDENGTAISGASMVLYKKSQLSLGSSDSILGKIFGLATSIIKNVVPIDAWITNGEPHIVDSSKVTPGKYTICEVTPPPGYEPDDETLLPCQTIEVKTKDEQVPVEFKNQPTKTRILKVDENGKPMAGIKMQILDVAKKKVLREFTTTDSEDGVIIIKLYKGVSYYLREVDVPEGYQKHDDQLFVAGGAGDNLIKTTVKMVNKPTEVEISKTDITDGKLIEGAKLYIVDSNGSPVHEWTTKAGKVETIKKLPAGKYKLCEEAAPEGYMVADCVDFEVKANEKITKVKMENKPINIKVIKIDAETKKPLAGAELQLVDPEDNNKVLETWTTDGNPHQIKAKVTLGKIYTIVESKAPEGYVATSVQFNAGDTETVEFTNNKTGIEVIKLDSETGNIVKGAHLQLYDDKGKLIEEWDTTDEVKTITGLNLGTEYTIKETKIPNGYKAQKAITKFKLVDSNQEIVIYNNPIVPTNPVVPVKNTAASTSIIIIVAGAVLMIGGVGALIFLKKKEG